MPAKPASVDQVQASFQHFLGDLQAYIKAEVARQLEERGSSRGASGASPQRSAPGRAWSAKGPKGEDGRQARPPQNRGAAPARPQRAAGPRPQTQLPGGRQPRPEPQREIPQANSVPEFKSQPKPAPVETAGKAPVTRQSPMWGILNRVTSKKQ